MNILFILGGILIGSAVGTILRRSSIKSNFLYANRKRISEQNEGIAEAWLDTDNSGEKKLVIKRAFKPPMWNSPTIKTKDVFRK